MAKITLQDLTNEQRDIVLEIADMFEISEEEALEQALADGSVSVGGGSGVPYLPDGYKELKMYTLNNKSTLFKANKAYKKDNKKDLFEEDNFYYDIQTPRIIGDDGKKTDEFDVSKMSAIEVGTVPEVIVTNVYYKGERKIFKGNNPQENNFETTLGSDMFEGGQREMIIKSKDDSIKGKSMYELIQGLRKQYGKEKTNVPQSEQYSFRIVIFGLVKINDSWEKFYFVALNRFSDDNMVTAWDKDRVGVKSNYLSKLIIDGVDANQNPIFKLEVIKKYSLDELKEGDLKQVIRDSVSNVSSWQKARVESALGGNKKASNETKKEETSTQQEEEESISWDD